jgi:amino acid transporter
MKESRNANNVMVGIKLVVIVLVIAVGIFNINTENWTPFMPQGIGGVLKGVSAVFFAYIGFDAISTTAEECKNPERDLPRGIMWAIIISTVLYVLLALVLTGMVHYDLLRVGDPLSFVFEKIGMKWFSAIIAVSAVVAMTSVLLVFQIGQPRIWLAMSRDGLLPKRFSAVHPKFRTPSYATVMTAIVVIVATVFIPTDEVINLCSMGTLVAFVLVCGGVLRLQNDPARPKGRFRTPYINGKYILPALLVVLAILFATLWRARLQEYLDFQSWNRDQDKIPVYLFIGVFVYLAVITYRRNLSLIPALGLLTSFYMMAHVPMSSWLGFFVWLVTGLAIYFSFGIRNSKLARAGRRKAQGA